METHQDQIQISNERPQAVRLASKMGKATVANACVELEESRYVEPDDHIVLSTN